MSKSLQAKLRRFARDTQSTPYAVLLASLLVLLGRQANSEELLIGVPVSLRDVLGIEGCIGPALNPLPFCMRVLPGDSFFDVVRRTRDTLGASFKHAALAFEEIASNCAVLNGMRGVPIPIQVIAQEKLVQSTKDGMHTFAEMTEREGQSPVALLMGIRTANTISIVFEYHSASLTDAAMLRIADAYKIITGELIHQPTRHVADARMLRSSRISRALAEAPRSHLPNLPQLTVGLSAGLSAGLTLGANKHPDRIALIFKQQQWTYRTLENLADQHARRLIDAGVRCGDHVIVASKKGVEEIVAAIAILKIGGVYVPIAWDTPAPRAAAFLSSTSARIITGCADLITAFSDSPAHEFVAVTLNDIVDATRSDHFSPCVQNTDPDASAYIL